MANEVVANILIVKRGTKFNSQKSIEKEKENLLKMADNDAGDMPPGKHLYPAILYLHLFPQRFSLLVCIQSRISIVILLKKTHPLFHHILSIFYHPLNTDY